SAGEEMGTCYRQLGERLERAGVETWRPGGAGSVPVAEEAERLARLAEGPARKAAHELLEQARRLRWHDLLLGQAERVRLDHWASEARQPAAEPYYVTAALRYLQDARTLLQSGPAGKPSPGPERLDTIARLETELRKPARLKLQAPQEVAITSE